MLAFVVALTPFEISASTWHKGIPNVAKTLTHWRSNLFRDKQFDFGKGYMRYLIFTSKSNKYFSYGTVFYLRNKKVDNQGDAEGILYNPVYKKLSNNKYIIKGTKYAKESLNWKYIIKKNGNNKLKIWMKGNFRQFHKWTYIGRFNKSKTKKYFY